MSGEQESVYPGVVGSTEIEYADSRVTCRVVQVAADRFVLEQIEGHDAMGQTKWGPIAMSEAVARALLLAYGRACVSAANRVAGEGEGEW